ncbi:hypothetical protein NADFUDRAFT_84382 [Nadsonia fulvescens var. elongata DSM 6958]|uniref:1,3-beta-glucanosyltransferase n=1 Tax=Nadsonia fulvescens var. elongata DSM 6958 TaxID=857566 RepID=A0A1E3PCM8_9ASCO|nr:hypothetical protein NADFUDRAFT_84382 [Nadsonia fulvescens var. elongata DSM 6958]
MLLESLLLFATLASAALPPIEIKGNAFFDSKSNDRFYIRGVDYQPGGASDFSDPLANLTVCTRDIAGFKDLGINTIRVYNVDNSANHDECMKLLDDAGIYVILDVNTPQNSISRNEPILSYNAPYLQHVFATIDSFKSYDNVLGFFAANEVINSVNTTDTATTVKAVIRDMKNYIKAQNPSRRIPVGYSVADVSENRFQQIEYFNCGDDEMARADMIGINDYSWCGSSSYRISGYADKVKQYGDISIPLFLSEFGCNKVTPREFSEITAIYSQQMSPVFSGGLVYEYTQEDNEYGLVKISDGSGKDSVEYLEDFTNLKKQYAAVVNPSGDGGYKSSGSAASCPATESGVWEANTSLPAMPSRASVYLKSGAGEALGTDVPSTQFGDPEEEENRVISSVASTASSSSLMASSVGSSVGAASQSASASTSKSAGSRCGAELLARTDNGVILGGLVILGSLVFGVVF